MNTTPLIANNANTFAVTPPLASEAVIRVDNTGRIFWHGREVETDADFRECVLEALLFMGGLK